MMLVSKRVITLGAETYTTTYGSYPGSPDPTPASATGEKHTVVVGGNGTLTFDPPSLIAKPRDQIVFELYVRCIFPSDPSLTSKPILTAAPRTTPLPNPPSVPPASPSRTLPPLASSDSTLVSWPSLPPTLLQASSPHLPLP